MLWLSTASGALLLDLPFGWEGSPGAAIALGSFGGVGLFLVLARTRPRASLDHRTAARTAHLALRAAHEEALWRGALLAVAAPVLGRGGAAVAGTLAFAAVHAPAQGRRAAGHLVTGGCFSVLAVGLGLPAAMASHAVYNALIGAVLAGRRPCPIRTVSSSGHPSYARRTTREHVPISAGRVDAEAILRLDDIVRRFGAAVALDGISLLLRPGEVVALLGPNGAGKSTAISIALGLRRPDRGRARLFGLDPSLPAARRQVGVCPQETSFPPTARVRELIELVRIHFPAPAATDDLLVEFGLAPLARRLAGGLSGGERRRLALALAFAGRPKVLFLDEPTVGLDVEARRSAWSSIHSFRAAGGAVLLTTHQLDEAEELASRIVVLDHGRIRTEGTAHQLRARSGTSRVTLQAATLPELPLNVRVQRMDGRYVLHTDDPDGLVELIVSSGVAFSGIEVTHISLEQAFLELTNTES